MQAMPSSQAASLAAWLQESVVSLQESVVQETVSEQSTAVPATHWPVPRLQVSAPLQYRPSAQSASSLHARGKTCGDRELRAW